MKRLGKTRIRFLLESTSMMALTGRKESSSPWLDLPRYPHRLSREAFYPPAYRLMRLSRRLDERFVELFERRHVKGTVATGIGNEAVAAGMALPFRPGADVASLLHRDLAAHLAWGSTPYQLVCQYMGNAESPTHGREGNVHHGDAKGRRFPMMSHLGKMPSTVVGATWAARLQGEDIFGLTIIGDGCSSTGEIHEAMNIASVHKVPVLFLIENNYYAFSTPTSAQYHCKNLSDRARGYGIAGRTIDGTNAWAVYEAVWDALDSMQADPAPAILECMTLRLLGHAVYDKADYITDEQRKAWWGRDPLPAARRQLQEIASMPEPEIAAVEEEVEREVEEAVARALKVARPDGARHSWSMCDGVSKRSVAPHRAAAVKNGDAVNQALDYILGRNPQSFLVGLDVGVYGSAFKTCKGLLERHGPDRVIDMPIGESGIAGFALGASQVGAEPIMEFQFSDFSTESVTQLGLNAGSWFFRSGCAAPILVRLPCGGGVTLGAFHSGEYEGLWGRFPGLKLLYPATPQETFEALVAGFYDRNPCLVFEHKLLYWSQSGDIDFDGDLEAVWRARRHTEGEDLTVVAFGAMVNQALAAAARSGRSVEVWNPFVLQPLDLAPILASLAKTGRLIVVQECGQIHGLGERLISRIACEGFQALKCPPVLIAAPDTPVPFAPELENCYRPNADRILAAIHEILGDS